MAIEAGSSGPRFVPVILAGGSGTRFWPRSRRAKAKQVLALDGERTMIQQTMDRLLPLASPNDFWVITNDLLDETIAEQLPEIPATRILSEPAARNTAPACALAAFLVAKTDPDAVLGVFPSDHVVGDLRRFCEVVRAGIELASGGEKIVVLGVPPTKPETGYGYIERGVAVESVAGTEVHRVKRFTEKPSRELAEAFLATGAYAWNGGIFLWKAQTLKNAIAEHCRDMVPLLEQIADAYGSSDFERVFAEVYPRCENISIDYAVLEPRSVKGEEHSEIYCLPADFDWNDLGCWSALHEHVADVPFEKLDETNVFDKADGPCVNIDSKGNYVYAPGKTIALVGVSDLVVVETGDALLITTRERSQDVGKVVTELKQAGRHDLI